MTDQTLIERIGKSKNIIGDLCKEGRCPKMTIPVHPDDEDIFIIDTLKQCEEALTPPLPEDVAAISGWFRNQAEVYGWELASKAADMLERLSRENQTILASQPSIESLIRDLAKSQQRIAELDEEIGGWKALADENEKSIAELKKERDHYKTRLDNAMEF